MLGFDQFFDVARPAPGWRVYGKGGSQQAGYYKVGEDYIVNHYNKCDYQRSQAELDLMSALHFAYKAGDHARAAHLLKEARMAFPECADSALSLYEGALQALAPAGG
jgi:hypothetical protein